MKANQTRTVKALTLVALLAALSASATDSPQPSELRRQALEFLSPVPAAMPGAKEDSAALVALGKALYFEKDLSENRSQSCATCHQVDGVKAGVDNQATSPGAFGKRGGRNSPTTLNAGFQFAQFWDGRAPDLVAQAKGPVLNAIEMAMPNEALVVQRLRDLPQYRAMFRAAFSAEAEPVTYENVARAIAAFERTLVTHDRFDDFLKGDDRALSRAELHGLREFMSLGCTTCHYGPVIGGQVYQKIGLIQPFPTDDKGRFDVTRDEDDTFKFKVPMLRNVALTHPYFHKGQIATIEEAVRKMAWHQLGKELDSDQLDALVAFLKTLTDKPRAKALGQASASL